MPSLRSTVLAAATIAFATFAQAKDYQIDPDSVTEDTRDRWCDDQMRICPYICEQTKPGTTEQNECWSDNLTYVCICGDGKPANVTKYTLTLPYYICQEYGNQCVAKCDGDNTCASDCREQNPCGATNPDRINATSSASGTAAPTASQTDDGTTIYTSPPGSGGDSSSSSGSGNGGGNGGSGAGALNSAQAFSLAVVFGTLFAGFAML